MEGVVLLSISMDIQQQNSFSAIYNTIEIIEFMKWYQEQSGHLLVEQQFSA